jgi:hypothetical protein
MEEKGAMGSQRYLLSKNPVKPFVNIYERWGVRKVSPSEMGPPAKLSVSTPKKRVIT